MRDSVIDLYLSGLRGSGPKTQLAALRAFVCAVEEKLPDEVSVEERDRLVSEFDWRSLSVDHLGPAFQFRSSTGIAQNTLARELGALRQISRLLCARGAISLERREDTITFDFGNLGRPERNVRAASSDEVDALQLACALNKHGEPENIKAETRDRLMLCVCWSNQAKPEEMAGATVMADGSVTFPTVQKDGFEPRALDPECLEDLSSWLSERGESPGPLFVQVTKTGTIPKIERMTTQGIRKVLMKRCEVAGVLYGRPDGLTWGSVALGGWQHRDRKIIASEHIRANRSPGQLGDTASPN